MSTTFEAHYARVSAALADGQVVPLLGAGVNLCDRPADGEWQAEKLLPSGRELAEHLAKVFWYPDGEALDLLRVSQWAVAREGPGPLYDELRKLFAGEYAPTRVHRFLASLPGVLRERGTPQHQVVVTTNYDDALERAFDDAGEPYDVVWYIADGEHRGKFWHRPPDGEPRLIERPKHYDGLALDERAVIVKIHGAVDRAEPDRDSYVITEDHYIDYLTQTDVGEAAPGRAPRQLARAIPLPRLQHAGLEPARDPAPDLGRAAARRTSRGQSSRTPSDDRTGALARARRGRPRHSARGLCRRSSSRGSEDGRRAAS